MTAKTLTNPDLSQLLIEFEENLLSKFNCCKIGKIIKFYPEDKTADIQILSKKEINGTLYDYPLLSKCLIIGDKITQPVLINDNCIVLFNDFNIDSYFETGTSQQPYNNRKHDLSDGIAILGVNSLVNKIEYDNNNIVLNYQSSIKIGENINLQANNNINITNNQASIEEDNSGLIAIKNNQQSLFTILNTFLTGLLNLKTGTSPTNANYVLDTATTTLINTTIQNLAMLLKD